MGRGVYYEFGAFRLVPGERLLFKNGLPISLSPRVFDTLVLLVENQGRLMEKSELMSKLWPNTAVEEVNLARNVSDLRKVLDEHGDQARYIETVPKSGYRFVAEVREQASGQGIGLVRLRWFQIAGLAAIMAVMCGWFVMTSRHARGDFRSVAVLPLRPLGPERNETLELGIADALIARLSRFRALEVRSIGTVRKYADTASDPIGAGRQLKVDAVLEGNIHSQPGAVRVTFRLLRVVDGSTIWSGSFDQPALQPFMLEDSVSSQVAAALSVQLTREEKKFLARHATENGEAYQLYLKGRFFWGRRNEDGFRKAIAYFQQAIEKDPSYALAYAGLADSYMLLGGYYGRRFVPLRDVIARARAAEEQALHLDPTLAEAHTTMALIHENYDWDWPATEHEYKLAIQLNPNYAIAHGWYGEFLAYMGRFEESFSEMQRAIELDPVSVSLNSDACQVFYLARQYDKAIEQCRRVLEMDPGFVNASQRLATSYLRRKMYTEALAEAQRLAKLQGDQSDPNLFGQIYAAAGDRESAGKYWKLLNAGAASEKILPFNRWSTALALGHKDEALDWLEMTYENHEVGLICIKTLPDLDPLRGEPRFQE